MNSAVRVLTLEITLPLTHEFEPALSRKSGLAGLHHLYPSRVGKGFESLARGTWQAVLGDIGPDCGGCRAATACSVKVRLEWRVAWGRLGKERDKAKENPGRDVDLVVPAVSR